MPEIALAVPFDASEVKDIACQEFRKRLDSLSPLSGLKEYNHFELEFSVKIRLSNPANMNKPKETLAWGKIEAGQPTTEAPNEDAEVMGPGFASGDPNEERQNRDMPLTVEVSDGKGGKVRKKVRVQ